MAVKRLEFANQLRAIAALLVIVAHYIGVFWASQEGVAVYRLGVPVLPGIDATSLPYGNFIVDRAVFFGEFGVGVFFLISGFVIPLSLRNKSIRAFFIERIFRIYPVYMVGFTICVLSLMFIAWFYSGNFRYSFFQIFVHYFLIFREWVGTPNIDGISWTLEVELKFYLFCAIFMKSFGNRRVEMLVFSAVLFFALSALWFPNKGTWYIGREMSAIHFMFIGVAFSFFLNNTISQKFFLLYISSNMILFSLLFMQTHLYAFSPEWLLGYVAAFAVFLISFYARSLFRPSRILSHFADISYPLYASHALAGYASLYFLVKNGFKPWISIAITFLAIYVISVLIHLYVEKPMLHYGKRMAKD